MLTNLSHAFEGLDWPANDDEHGDKPIYHYLPVKSDSLDANDVRDDIRLNRDRWTVAPTSGVQFNETDDEIAVRSAVFDDRSLIELIGSSEFDTQNLSVELWFRSDQVWDAKYWPGAATLVSKFTSGWASSDWGIIGGSLTDGVNEGRILVGVGPAGGGDVVLASPTGLNDGKYHHWVWTRNQVGENVLFIDGNSVDRAKDNGGSITNARPF